MTTSALDTNEKIPAQVTGRKSGAIWRYEALTALARRFEARGFSVAHNGDTVLASVGRTVVAHCHFTGRRRTHLVARSCVPNIMERYDDSVQSWVMSANVGKRSPSVARFAAILIKRLRHDLAAASVSVSEFIHDS